MTAASATTSATTTTRGAGIGGDEGDTSSSSSTSVWVIGGGFAGLATAAALSRIAHVPHVVVLEKFADKQFHDDTMGAGAQLGPNGLKALKLIAGNDDLVEKILKHGHEMSNVGIVLPNKNQTVMLIPETSKAETGLPQVIIPWGLLRKFLQELVPSKSIYTNIGNNICGYDINNSSTPNSSDSFVVVPVDDNGNTVGPPSTETEERSPPLPSLLVAADGIDSPYQSLLRIQERVLTGPDAHSIRESNVQDNGRVNVKAVVDMELDYDMYDFKDFAGQPIPKGTALAYNAPDGSIACFAGPAGQCCTYWAISVKDGVDERGTVTKYFAHCTAETRQPIKDRLLGMLRALKARECQFAIDLMEATPADKIYSQRSRQLTVVGPSFVSHDGKVVCVGDSAHAMSPAYGQGANFAFEDAATLALSIKHHADDLEAALESYSDQRLGRCEEMFRRSAERVAKQAKGEHTEDVFKWISRWEPAATMH